MGPACGVHPEIDPEHAGVFIEAVVEAFDRTGVEIEALVAASIAALTVIDMCKALDRTMSVRSVVLKEKLGGRSGHFLRQDTLD